VKMFCWFRVLGQGWRCAACFVLGPRCWALALLSWSLPPCKAREVAGVGVEVQHPMALLIKIACFSLVCHALGGRPASGQGQDGEHRPHVWHLFPNGTAETDKTFSMIFKHFEDT